MATVQVERQGAVTIVTLNRPEVHNCIDPETAVALAEALGAFRDDPEARALVVTGAGDRAFCSGADLRRAGDLFDAARRDEVEPLRFSTIAPDKPTFAAIEGHCLAGGLELALWCDVRIAGDAAGFGVLNRRWGIPLVDGGTQRLPRAVGMGNALYLISTGARIGAETALRMGLVQEVVPAGRALERTLVLAEATAAHPQASLRGDRRSALAAPGRPLDEGLRAEVRDGLEAIGSGEEMSEGLARFAGRDRPPPVEGG